MAQKMDTQLSKADAAKLVRRMVAKRDGKGAVVLDQDRNPVAVESSVREDEVMSYAEYDDRVVVVTVAGEKLACEKSSAIYRDWAARAAKK